MNLRITTHNLDAMQVRLLRALIRTGTVEPDAVLLLSRGSKTYGNSYRISVVTGDGQSDSLFGTFHWGFTARDCYDRMATACCALEAVPLG